MLGRAVAERLAHDWIVVPHARSQADLADLRDATHWIAAQRPAVLLLCARELAGGMAQVGDPQPGPRRIRPFDQRPLVRSARCVGVADGLESGRGAHVAIELRGGRKLARLEDHQSPTVRPLPEAIEAPRSDHVALGRPRTEHHAVRLCVVAHQHGEMPQRPSTQSQVLEDEDGVAGGELCDRVAEKRGDRVWESLVGAGRGDQLDRERAAALGDVDLRCELVRRDVPAGRGKYGRQRRRPAQPARACDARFRVPVRQPS